jgi:exodeoxyribonuclease VII small subunit
MAKEGASFETYDEITGRLDEIVADVRDKDTSLERSLDLLDEAIELGSRAVEMVDKVEFTPAEQQDLAEGEQAASDEPEETEAADREEAEAAEGDSGDEKA